MIDEMSAPGVEQRKVEEMVFHDQRERDRHALSDDEYQRKYSNRKWYSVTRQSTAFLKTWLRSNVRDKTVLDYCCGLGGTSLQLAQYGATVYGIDISQESIETARKKLTDAGLGRSGHFKVMDGEAMTFEDDKFDVIVCFGVLHHLDVAKAFPELCRVLKPDGRIIAAEALGYNPLIAAYRRMTPNLRTAWEAKHILTMKELRVARSSFASVAVHFFHLFDILAVPFRRTRLFPRLLGLTNFLDRVALRIPGLRLMAWQMIFILREPRKSDKVFK